MGQPICARALQSACFWSGPVFAEGIMASGSCCRTNRSNTWPHRPAGAASGKPLANGEPSTHGAKRTFAIFAKLVLGCSSVTVSGIRCSALGCATVRSGSLSHSSRARCVSRTLAHCAAMQLIPLKSTDVSISSLPRLGSWVRIPSPAPISSTSQKWRDKAVSEGFSSLETRRER